MSWHKALTKNKFRSKRMTNDGYSFASQGESAMYSQLKLEERAGEIEILKVQDHIKLSAAEITYIADFKIKDLKTNEEIWVEFKGFETPEWRIKRRLWMAYGPGKLRVYKSTGGVNKRIFLHEQIDSQHK